MQGLKAFLLSSPYDCPPWMPRVLMALVRCASAASQEASLRSAAAKALSEFKRTHEADSMEALKAMMDSDEWESMLQVTSPASYFT
ncbi:hypothetical protein DUNSADRAFT_13108 [Dunaliella salina]|uniref:Proteasome activator complex subunit 4 C-terminal domain-containing protein n=1 Tax=Dunaliella salina TaxID=3046 RepID=A0ABQ7GA31_DUNSA|nr:hypothetical protein DUNSADRAFT_13108 [Dunaliella salina]|eukprot:KAF5831468.1 hypothetical protein DUNSADRAFT_13108 [Dunaliella salina]